MKIFRKFAGKKLPRQVLGQLQQGGKWLKDLKLTPPQILGLATIGILLLIWNFGGKKSLEIVEVPNDQQLNERPISGVKSAVDPRVYWASELSKEMKELKQQLNDSINRQSESTKQQIEILEQKIDAASHSKEPELELTDEDMGIRVLPASSNEPSPNNSVTAPDRQKMGHVKRVGGNIQKNIMDYIPSGSFARGVLLSGVVVGTGTEASARRKQVMIRLVDHAIFAKAHFNEQVKDATIIGSCEGDISSERAECRLESISFYNRQGQIIENHAVQGWLNGEDGLPGIRGKMVDKSSDIARMALLTGMLSGMSQFFQNQATKGVFPISPITGQQNALKAGEALKGSAFAGSSNALEDMSKYIIKKAEQLSPVIIVASGRVIDVVFMKGFGLKNADYNNTGKLVPTPTGIDHNKEAEEYLQADNSSAFGGNKSPTNMQQKFLEGDELASHLSSARKQGEF